MRAATVCSTIGRGAVARFIQSGPGNVAVGPFGKVTYVVRRLGERPAGCVLGLGTGSLCRGRRYSVGLLRSFSRIRCDWY